MWDCLPFFLIIFGCTTRQHSRFLTVFVTGISGLTLHSGVREERTRTDLIMYGNNWPVAEICSLPRKEVCQPKGLVSRLLLWCKRVRTCTFHRRCASICVRMCVCMCVICVCMWFVRPPAAIRDDRSLPPVTFCKTYMFYKKICSPHWNGRQYCLQQQWGIHRTHFSDCPRCSYQRQPFATKLSRLDDHSL